MQYSDDLRQKLVLQLQLEKPLREINRLRAKRVLRREVPLVLLSTTYVPQQINATVGLVEAWKAGYGTQAEWAEWFGVSLRGVEKVLRRWRTTGQTAARRFRHGPLPVVSPARLERLVQRRPAATLAE
jgi:hypothetical protein